MIINWLIYHKGSIHSLPIKWYQSQGHGFESWKCQCERGIVRGTTIWLPTTTLKTGLCGVMSNAIKYLGVLSLSPVGLEVEWHSSRSDKEPSFTAWERVTEGSLAEMTGGVVGEALLVCYAPAGVTSFWGVGISARVGTDSQTLSVWAFSLIGLGLGEGIGALVGAPCAIAEVDSMALAIMSTPSKKPSTGMRIAAETSSLVGWKIKRGSGSIEKQKQKRRKKRKKEDEC